MARQEPKEVTSPFGVILHSGKKMLLNAVKAGITFGILFYLYRKGMLDFTRVRAVFSHLPTVLATFVVLLSTTMATVIRWRWLLQGQKLNVSLGEAFRLTMIGVFFNTAIPGAVSGDLVKGYYVVRQQPSGRGRIRAFTTLLLDRVLGLSALICVSFCAMVFNLSSTLENPMLKPLCGLVTLLWLGVVAFYAFVLIEWPFTKYLLKLLHRLPAGDYLVKLFEAVKGYESCRHYIYRGLGVSVIIHCSVIGVFIMLAKALGGFEAVALSKFFFLVPFGLLVTAIPVAPAGLGTGHAAFLGLFQLAGSTAGADLFTSFVGFQIVISLLGGLFYLRYRGNLPKA